MIRLKSEISSLIDRRKEELVQREKISTIKITQEE